MSPDAVHSPQGVLHGASFDVEDYRQILRRRWQGEAGPVNADFDRDVDALCALLDETQTKATFFVTGTVAADRPDLVRHWQGLGHEIACHGWDHTQVWQMNRDQFRADLTRTRKALEDACGQTVRGYRAAVFSIGPDTLWALDVLAECGFDYDSSIVPVRCPRYGIDGFDRRPALYRLPDGGRIVELPLPVSRVMGRTRPVGGGGNFRVLSLQAILQAVDEHTRGGLPFVMYCHPDELGGRKFRATDLARGLVGKGRAWMLEFRSNIGRSGVPRIVRGVLAKFDFTTLCRLADKVRDDGAERVLGTIR
ncbi:MAG: polysaccharide deacetylase family protein [Planctomycetes bacterium]|nr:polysaccharide deacetylase family protein [Planctomycetota bacterium]